MRRVYVPIMPDFRMTFQAESAGNVARSGEALHCNALTPQTIPCGPAMGMRMAVDVHAVRRLSANAHPAHLLKGLPPGVSVLICSTHQSGAGGAACCTRYGLPEWRVPIRIRRGRWRRPLRCRCRLQSCMLTLLRLSGNKTTRSHLSRSACHE